MKQLSATWFTDGYIDFELKKYTLLAYLQQIQKCFHETALYPSLADVIFHYQNLVQFKQSKQLLQNQFPKKITGFEMQKLQLVYEQMMADAEVMKALEEIVDYAEGKLKNTIEEGTCIYEFIEKQLTIEPVGIVSLRNEEGFLLLEMEEDATIHLYQFKLSFYERHHEPYRTLRTEALPPMRRQMMQTNHQLKLEVVKQYPYFGNPAVYFAYVGWQCPLQETVLPIAKRSLVKKITAA
ncbi:MAG: hypothetical protein EAY72_12695 [Bacteroidetes bacterium]|nr:MAG: hypothetical protein EAY72_12695 [Bacteroidota bacterium]